MEIPSHAPSAFGPLFAIERTRLLELLRGLTPGDWSRPTPCPAWNVHELSLHLLGVDVSLLSWHRDHHRGTPAPDGLDKDGFIGWLDELQAEWVHAARRLSPAITIELLEWAGPRVVELVELVESQDPTARTAHVSWASSEPVPRWLDHARELSEQWIHRQQLLQAVGQPSDLRADVAGPVLDGLRWAYPYRLAEHRPADGTVVEIAITGSDLDRVWRLARADGGWSFDPATTAAPVARLAMTADQAWRQLTNNAGDDENSRPEIAGDASIVRTLLRTRAIIGSPDAMPARTADDAGP